MRYIICFARYACANWKRKGENRNELIILQINKDGIKFVFRCSTSVLETNFDSKKIMVLYKITIEQNDKMKQLFY